MSPKKILLVEDNPDDELLAVRVFSKCGFRCNVTVARDGAEALQLINDLESEQLPDFVLLDIKLPKVNGLEVLESIRANNKTKYTPVVVFSSSNESCDISKVYELCGNSYVRKPVEYKEYTDTVNSICDYWLGHNLQQQI